MNEKSKMDMIKGIFKNRFIKCALFIMVLLFVLWQYTGFVARSFDNSTPKKAIAEYIYKETSDPTLFFIDIDKQDELKIPQGEDKENYQYYVVVFNGFFNQPGDMGGTFKLSKVGNEYYVVKYLGYEGYS